MRLCLIYNFAQHYRTNIFTLMDQSFDIDFVFGDRYLDVKKADYSLFRHDVTEVKNIEIGPFLWQRNVVKRAFGRYDCLIMLGQFMCISTWVTALLAKATGKKVCFWSHGWYGRENLPKRIIKKVFFRLADQTLLYGNYARDIMVQNGFDSERIHVIHNSLHYDRQIEIRKDLKPSSIYLEHFANNAPTVVFVGRLTKIKKLDILLQAQHICSLAGCNFNVVLIGSGEEELHLQQTAATLHLQHSVWFYGPCYNEDELSSLLYNADLCVAPGNIGLTAMHAMAFGCPCISHNDFKNQMPEFEAILEGVTGRFFERDNVESLAAAIQSWFSEHSHDREAIRQACFSEIDNNWNPHRQLEIIKKALSL